MANLSPQEILELVRGKLTYFSDEIQKTMKDLVARQAGSRSDKENLATAFFQVLKDQQHLMGEVDAFDALLPSVISRAKEEFKPLVGEKPTAGIGQLPAPTH